MITIHSISTKFSGYGHWKVTIVIDNPALNYTDDDYYWNTVDHGKEDEPSRLTLTKTTTNSRAIDGYDGYEHALASEVLTDNEFDSDDFNFENLKSEDEE